MNQRSLILVFFALLAAGGSAYLANSWITAQKGNAPAEPQAVAPAAYVLVAKKQITVGSFIKPDNLAWQSWPDDNLPEAYLVKEKNTMEEMSGSVARASLAPGQPITHTLVVKPGARGFLAAILEPGMRAASININPASGLAGLVFPGDRVDVILTQSLGTGPSARRASETILSGLRVLAVDQRVDPEGGPAVAKTATLEVTQKQAEILTVTSELGRLSLSLHALSKQGQEGGEESSGISKKPTWDRDISQALRSRSGGGGIGVTVLRGK